MITQTLKRHTDSFAQIGSRHVLMEFVLKNGREFTAFAALTYPKGPPKQCFHNAGSFTLGNPGTTYVEGYCARQDFTFHHAWAVNAADEIIDPTLAQPMTVEYFGIKIPHQLLVRQLTKNRVYGLFDIGRGPNLSCMEKIDPAFVKSIKQQQRRSA